MASGAATILPACATAPELPALRRRAIVGDAVVVALVAFADVPLVGDDLQGAFSDVGAETGGNTAELGASGAAAVEDTAPLLGWVTFALPTLAVLLWAVPRRVSRMRRLTAAGRVLAGAQGVERRRLLAMRAAFGLPYDTLLAHTPDPFGALADGHYEPLLGALFEDAGLRPPKPT